MKIQTIRERLLASTMMGGVALMAAVALPAAAIVLAPTSASAQDYTTGAISGTVQNQAGSPVSGASVTIRSTEQGFSRSTTTNASGVFRASLVPLGNYEVTINAPGYETSVDPNVTVRLGGEFSYTFTVGSSDESTNVDEIVVVGTRPELDFAQTTTGLTIDVAELVKQVPLSRSVTAVALLAPRAVAGDSAFGDQPSLGGGSVAENAFYVNGLNITNFNTYVGGAPVPFDFYRTVEVKTGGYPAEFGRATGGVINAVTKSGTNDFMFALHGNYAPDSLREQSPNTYTTDNGRRYDENWSVIAELGGPIIRDRLYAYGLYQWQDSEVNAYSITGGTQTVSTADDPFYGVKLDAYITDSQRLEFTYFDTTSETTNTAYSFNPTTGDVGTTPIGNNISSTNHTGGENYVARYTGNWTDWLTLSAAYGVNKDSGYSVAGNLADVYVRDFRDDSGRRLSPNQTAGTSAFQSTEREFYRVDADITFNWMGDHHVRLGMDNEDTTLSHIVNANGTTGGGTAGPPGGGGALYYYYSGEDDFTDDLIAPSGQEYISVITEELGAGGAGVEGNNRAFYIQDAWDITDDLSVSLGLRHDEFKLSNLAGQEVLDLKENWGPRLGFTIDPFGNGVDKFYANYGRYFIPPASNLSFRGADYYFQTFFLPAGDGPTIVVDPTTGLPVGGVGSPIIGGQAGALVDCPAGSPNGTAGLQSCFVYGDGTAEPFDAKTSTDLKATNEDEFIVGYERQINDLWSVGVAATYRKLNQISEDVDVGYLVEDYCNANGIAGCEGTVNYIVMNPGEDVEFLVQRPLPDGSRPTVSFTAAEVGLPKASRRYTGLEFSFERAFDGIWSLQGSYVLSKSIGNYEGTVLSDNGQTDAGSTILYDYVGLTDGTYGLLPNHHAHQFKLFGSYQILDGLTVGANYSLISPRHYGCLGRHPTDASAGGYGNASFYCGGVLTPRGSQFTNDWQSTLDLSLRYTLPTMGVLPGGVTLRADVFNVFDEFNISDALETTGANYQKPTGYQTPRYVRLGFDIEF